MSEEKDKSTVPNRPARPWDLLNKNIERVTEDLKESRMSICRDCKYFVSLTQQCTQCGCIMPAKTTLPHAECPKGKWGKVEIGDIGFKDSK
jgi:hypothetical protein